jgi:hypothetical protein
MLIEEDVSGILFSCVQDYPIGENASLCLWGGNGQAKLSLTLLIYYSLR